ncbi:MAG: CidA/LrgA family protein [Azonexus sp.]
MLGALTQILCFQLVGEAIARGLGLPLPGPVLGMLLLFLALTLRGGASANLQTTSQTLLQHLSLLFVPAGTGIVVHLHRVADEWLPLLVALMLSTAAALAVTAGVMMACRPTPGEPT